MSDDHTSAVNSAVVSPDGLRGATATRAGEIRWWDLTTGRLVRVGSADGVESAAFTATGQLVTTGDWTAARWTDELAEIPDVGEWAELAVGSRVRIADDGDGRATALVPSGGRLLVGHDAANVVHAWHLAGRDIRSLPHHWLSPRWSYEDEPADQRLLCGCDDGRLVVSPRPGRLVVLDAATGAVVCTIAAPEPTALAGHPDLPVVALADRTGELRWWDATTGEQLGRVRAHRDRIRGLAVAGEALLTASRDGTAALWHWDSGALLGRFDPASPDCAAVPAGRQDPFELALVAGARDGSRWLVGGHGGQVHVLDHELTPVRRGQPRTEQAAFDVADLLDCIRTGTAIPTLTVDEFGGDAYPYRTDELVEKALVEAARSDDLDVVETSVRTLARVNASTAARTCQELYGRWPGLAERLLNADQAAGELLERLPHADHFTAELLFAVLAERGAVEPLHAVLRELPPAWQEIDGHRLVRAVERIDPDPRRGLELMLTSATPRVRRIALDAYSSGYRYSRQGGLRPLYDSEVVDRAVHDCAVRELTAAEPDNQYDAMYAMWFCYLDEDAPLIARVLATTRDASVVDVGLTLLENVFETDPHIDGGLLDALHRMIFDPEEDYRTRQQAIRHVVGSAREDVVSWLVTALDDSDHRVVAAAALALLMRDEKRFAARVAPLVEGWEDTDGCGWEIGEARSILESHLGSG